jgi:hypothetical protein
MIDPFGSRAFDRGNTDVLSQILGGGDAEKELLLIRQALVEFFFFRGHVKWGLGCCFAESELQWMILFRLVHYFFHCPKR